MLTALFTFAFDQYRVIDTQKSSIVDTSSINIISQADESVSK